MTSTRTARVRLFAAVAAVLAVTTTAGIATPAFADAPVQAVMGEQDILRTLPADSALVSAGRSGMLSVTDGQFITYRWTRFSDGVTTILSGTRWGAQGTDTVATQNGSVYTLIDMSWASEPIVIDTSSFNTAATPYRLDRVVGSTLVMTTSVAGVTEYHLVSKEDGQVVNRKVVLPEGSRPQQVYTNGPGTLALQYDRTVSGVGTEHVAVVDPATGAVTETYDTLASTASAWSTVEAPGHVAWVETPYGGGTTLAVARRGTTEVERTSLDPYGGSDKVLLRLVGDWVTYDRNGGGTATWTDILHPLAARSLKTGETVRLLDHVGSSTLDADGNLLVLGGTVEQGEGLYRIAPGADGTPAAALVTSAGRPTVLTMEKETPPPSGVVDFDRNGDSLKASWTLSRYNAVVSLAFTHTASGLKRTMSYPLPRAGMTDFPFIWEGRLDNGVPAYNGDYSWRMLAKPANGIGPDIVRTGTFTVTRAPKPHDFDDNGSPDLLSRDGAGRLRSYDIDQIIGSSMTQPLTPVDLGTGWDAYDRITATGDIAGTTAGDVVTRDKTGVLWFHQGNGKGLAPRTKIGGGWQIYNKLTAGSDLTGDGRPDLVATDKAGDLYLYKATGNATAPFAPRKKIGFGWGVYNQLTASGNIAGAAAGDLVARDSAGVLWLYLGKGDGTFAPRTKIGSGWNPYDSLVGVGDFDHDGKHDLVAYDADGGYYGLYLYKGTGDWRAPFKRRWAPYNPGLGDGTVELF